MKRPKLIQNGFNMIRYIAFRVWPEAILKLQFKRRTGYSLDLENPQTFNEKVQWLKLYWYDPKATICADKYMVRGYVKEKGLGHLLNDLYGVYDDVEDINLDELPDEFVMKVNHGCGQNLICTDKTNLDWNAEKKKFKQWLKKSHYLKSLEWVYRDIQPKIIVERLIKTTDGKLPKDYKVFCFNGEPKCIFVTTDRGIDTKFDFYDLDWNYIPVKNHHPNSREILERPSKLDDILEYSKILSEGFPHMRVDFYLEGGKIIFGECTFFHFSGNEPFEPIKYDYKLGEYLDLSMGNKNI